jgi:hypothetical protein
VCFWGRGSLSFSSQEVCRLLPHSKPIAHLFPTFDAKSGLPSGKLTPETWLCPVQRDKLEAADSHHCKGPDCTKEFPFRIGGIPSTFQYFLPIHLWLKGRQELSPKEPQAWRDGSYHSQKCCSNEATESTLRTTIRGRTGSDFHAT